MNACAAVGVRFCVADVRSIPRCKQSRLSFTARPRPLAPIVVETLTHESQHCTWYIKAIQLPHYFDAVG